MNNSVRICFVSCFNKTPFLLKIAKTLQAELHYVDVHWVSTSKKWVEYLIKEGCSESNICYIDKNKVISEGEGLYASELIEDAEIKNKVSLNYIIQSDRIIRHWNSDEALNYSKNVTVTVANYFFEKNIKYVFSEATAVHETLIAFLAPLCGYKFLKPHTVRIPSDRFAFFQGFKENNIYCRELEEVLDSSVNNCFNDVVKCSKKPAYFYKNNKRMDYMSKDFLLLIIKKMQESIVESKSDASVKSLNYQLFREKKFLTPLKIKLLSLFSPFEKEFEFSKPYVLFTLHKQPEASIDVLAQDYCNQIEAVRKIALSIPSKYQILVKEHSNAVGERPFGFYKCMKKIPSVSLVSPYLDSHELLKNSSLVITVSGTVAYEASLFGIPSITLAPMFFNSAICKHAVGSVQDINRTVVSLLEAERVPEIGKIKEIISVSRVGLIGDVLTSPNVVSDANINNVTKAFIELIEGYCLEE